MFDEILIPDNLREAILIESSENYALFEDLRKNFLFLLFSHFSVGGSLCQYEDYVGEYLEVTKAFYKEYCSAAKDENGNMYIRSLVFKIEDIEGADIFKTKTGEYQNFFYISIDPYLRQCNVLFHEFVPYW